MPLFWIFPTFRGLLLFSPCSKAFFTDTEAPWRPAACVALRRTALGGGARSASSAWRRSHGNSSATWNSWTRALAIGWCCDGAGYHGIYGMMVIDSYWWQCGIWDGYKLCSIIVKYGLSENGIHGDSWDGDRCLLYVGWSYVFRSLFQGGWYMLILLWGYHGMMMDTDMPESVIWNGRTTWGIESNRVKVWVFGAIS